MTLDDKDQYIRELEQKLTDYEQKNQNDKLDRITEKLESLEEKIETNHSDSLDENKFEDAENNQFPTNCYIKDDKVRGLLSASETPVSHVQYRGKVFGGQYDKIVITNKRLIFYKIIGSFSKKIKSESIPIEKLGFPTVEEKGLISKKAILKVDIGMEEPLRWDGNPSDIQSLNQEILSVLNA